jgi:hypothetical protein
MYNSKSGKVHAEWAIDKNGNAIPGTVKEYPEGKEKTDKEMLPRMDRIMRYGNV